MLSDDVLDGVRLDRDFVILVVDDDQLLKLKIKM